jgi:hypothetical protein
MLPNKPHGARPVRPKTALLGVAVRRTVARYAGKLAHAQPAIIASFAGGTRASGDQIITASAPAHACPWRWLWLGRQSG